MDEWDKKIFGEGPGNLLIVIIFITITISFIIMSKI